MSCKNCLFWLKDQNEDWVMVWKINRREDALHCLNNMMIALHVCKKISACPEKVPIHELAVLAVHFDSEIKSEYLLIMLQDEWWL